MTDAMVGEARDQFQKLADEAGLTVRANCEPVPGSDGLVCFELGLGEKYCNFSYDKSIMASLDDSQRSDLIKATFAPCADLLLNPVAG